ncbi:glyoxalase superfamily protein [Roseicyclus persicicus]|uniref:Bleomycin resistance protein n=1 Tax=Roseicyclus persicicus TaxID=2650661 RepID=A0A7X6GVQ6_9RHOB|nr:glyoxalase superfamily protein [Roseibacterium persicicum]NKX43281.1 VOC family protein [Roseibacterium persicicum]
MPFQSPIPVLRSFDEAATRAFYLDFLGFAVLFEHRFDPTAPLYLAVRLGACELHLSEHHGDATPGSTVRIGVADVHTLSAELRAKPYPRSRPGVTRQPWGLDEAAVTDPSGNRLVFWSEPRDG